MKFRIPIPSFLRLKERAPRPLDSRRLLCIRLCLAVVIFSVCMLCALAWTISPEHLAAISSPFVACFGAIGVISGASGASFAAEHWGAAAPSSWSQRQDKLPSNLSDDPGQTVA